MVQSCISSRKGNEALYKTPSTLHFTRRHLFSFVILVVFAFLTPLVVMADETKAPAPAVTAAAATAAPAPATANAVKPADAAVPAVAAAVAPATPPDVKPVLNTGDTAWMLISAALVLLMIPGLALFYGGMVRQKNVLSTMMHSLVAMGIVGVQWSVIGYSLSFGPDMGHMGLIGDCSKFMLNGLIIMKDAASGTVEWALFQNYAKEPGAIPELVFAMYQAMFAIITVALISGAMAERVKFSAYCVFVLLWTTLVYDPLAHWVWMTDGWLFKKALSILPAVPSFISLQVFRPWPS